MIRACDVILKGDTDALKLLIENGLDVNGQGVGGLTLLHWAFACEDLQCFRVFLEAGADPDVPLSKGLKSRDEIMFYTRDTILHTCARRDGWWKYLMDGLKYCQRPDLIGAGNDKLTNLVTNSRGSARALRAVLEAGANPNFEDSGQSGFVKALISEDYEAVAVLLDHNADPIWGDFSADEMLQLIQKRIVRYSAERGDPEFAVLSRFREAVLKRAEEQE